ncbi:MAG: response regulator [Anaerolineae bacterium]|nr:response regulator [Anaerolineae bacterium]
MDTAKIVLADDHAVVRAGIRNALTELPNLDIVGEVGDGPSLLVSLAETQPDCLLIDVAMPNFEPVAAIRQVRAAYPNLKILVVSAYDDDEYVQGMLGAGVNGYHLKDQSLSDLKLAVQRVLAGERWVSSRLVNKLVSFSGQQHVSSLTNRQREILRLLHQGLDNHTIARQMGLSVKTIENHLTRLYRQLEVQSRLEAVNFVIQHPEVLGKAGRPLLPFDALSEEALAERITILVVDDNLRYRHQLRRMLGRVCPQATIYEAGSIQAAINTAQEVKPHLALVDVVLGDEDGIGCTRRLKAQVPSVRVVLISAYPDREFHRLGLEAGAIAFLDKKDLDAAALRQVIDDVI